MSSHSHHDQHHHSRERSEQHHHGEKHDQPRTYDRPWRPADPPRVTHAEWPQRTPQRPPEPLQSADEGWIRVRGHIETLLTCDYPEPMAEVILALRAELTACEDTATRAQLQRDHLQRELNELTVRYLKLERAAREIADQAPTSDVFFGRSVWLPFAYVEGLRGALAGDGEQEKGEADR